MITLGLNIARRKRSLRKKGWKDKNALKAQIIQNATEYTGGKK